MSKVSIIVPFLNEAQNLPIFRQRLEAVLAGLDMAAEVILVDDGSSDGSSAIAEAWHREDDRVGYIRLSRNFGSHAAAFAGIRLSTGDATVLLASDLQNPPEILGKLVDAWRQGAHVVWGVSDVREDQGRLSSIFARIFYLALRRFALPNFPANGSDLFLIDHCVRDALNEIREKHTNIFALICWMGYRQTSVSYQKQPRRFGKSKWGVWKKVKLLVDSLLSFSYTPIRFVSACGAVVSVLGVIFALVTVVRSLSGVTVQGWSSLMVVTLVVGGGQLLLMGVLGEYVWRTFDEARGRPRSVVQSTHRPRATASARSTATAIGL